MSKDIKQLPCYHRIRQNNPYGRYSGTIFCFFAPQPPLAGEIQRQPQDFKPAGLALNYSAPQLIRLKPAGVSG
jgi:hypothetical protein